MSNFFFSLEICFPYKVCIIRYYLVYRRLGNGFVVYMTMVRQHFYDSIQISVEVNLVK